MEKGNKYKVDIFTGIRPTGVLTVANAVGAVKPLLKLQSGGMRPMVFVADMHGLTDHEPDVLKKNVLNVVVDYISLGLDPEKVDIFVQSEIASEVSQLTLLLMRHVTVSELIRVPTLKDKIRSGHRPETANSLLAAYPVMMAADILLQRARYVPVGEDQKAHLEMTRLIAKRFNKRYGSVFPLPKTQNVDLIRVMSLSGGGKMSKSNPSGAIFLTDTKEEVKNKIKRAETAVEKEMPDVLKSHFTLARNLTDRDDYKTKLDEIESSHLQGEKVMGDFKNLLNEIVQEFLSDYKEKRNDLLSNMDYVNNILEEGAKIAKKNAQETLEMVDRAMSI